MTDDARATLIREAIRFANWAAGQGICPIKGQDAIDPETFLMDYSDATGDDEWNTLADRAAAEAAGDGAAAEGWRLVPVEPTGPMIDAAILGDKLWGHGAIPRVVAAYRAMLAAAPSRPSGGR